MERRDRKIKKRQAQGGIGGRCRATVTGYGGEGRDGNAEGNRNGRAEDGGRGDKGSGDGGRPGATRSCARAIWGRPR